MDGGIASYQEGLLKPDPAIFELFLTRYGKRAEECVFVDDTPVNAEAAATLGFHSIILKNIDDLTDELKKIDELANVIEA
jgi:putative hydrolase of the HAD superfamily